jgi:N-sulfoglucosamine sulfohydrolase
VLQARELGVGRDPVLFAEHSGKFFAAAKAAGKPFFLMANSQDPHRPFAKSRQETARKKANPKKKKKASNFPVVENPYKPGDIPVPGFLPALDKIKTELAQYYTSVRRADRIMGAVLKELDKAGLAGNTLVMFLSDHGMPLPFAKTNCYYHSTRTPWIVRLPGVTKPGSVDRRNMVSGIDLTPTVLDLLGLPPLEGMDGRSFRPLLSGKEQAGRDRIFTHFHRTAGRRDYPMRSVLTRRWGYIYNGWADGETVFKNESQNGLTMAAMKAAAGNNSSIAERVKLFLYRVPEELYDYEKDPDALHNLIGDPAHKERVESFRSQLAEHMKDTADPQLATFNKLLGN